MDTKIGRRFVVECVQVNKEDNVPGRSGPGLGDKEQVKSECPRQARRGIYFAWVPGDTDK
jgi:hypothetical protein